MRGIDDLPILLPRHVYRRISGSGRQKDTADDGHHAAGNPLHHPVHFPGNRSFADLVVLYSRISANDLQEGLSELCRNRLLWTLSIIVIFAKCTSSMLDTAIIFYAKDHLELSNSEWGFVLSAGRGGGLAGSILIPRMKRIFAIEPLIANPPVHCLYRDSVPCFGFCPASVPGSLPNTVCSRPLTPSLPPGIHADGTDRTDRLHHKCADRRRLSRRPMD